MKMNGDNKTVLDKLGMIPKMDNTRWNGLPNQKHLLLLQKYSVLETWN